MKPSLLFRLLKISIALTLMLVFYFTALYLHAQRQQTRNTEVTLTSDCEQKLSQLGLVSSKHYQTDTGALKLGYTSADVRAIQRGCNLISDLQGRQAKDEQERWSATRYVRSKHTSCGQCHRGLGDQVDPQGQRIAGTIHLGAAWSNGGDTYDRFTGMLLPFELRQMQCFINSSNGYKPNIADDVIRDITAYSRFLAAAANYRIQASYAEQGVVEIPSSLTPQYGDDYVRGAHIFDQKCAQCHGDLGEGREINGLLIAPAVAGPNAFNSASRNNFANESGVLAGFICANMPLGQEGTLAPQDCRDIAYYISTIPRPASDQAGPIPALWRQLLMAATPALLELINDQDDE